MKVALIDTGAANLASVQAGLRRVGAEIHLVSSPEDVGEASHLVLPGVGALGQTRKRLDHLGLTPVIRDWFRSQRPMLAICLGLHLLFETSEESPEAEGFGFFPGPICRFDRSLRVPQMGWNEVKAPSACRFLRSGSYYFANSFARFEPVEGASHASCDHGGHFVAAFETESLLACQFHPELSGRLGTELLGRWLRESLDA